jgi:peptidoglycan hydrolase-like protein with peptidoglycan-binding domain
VLTGSNVPRVSNVNFTVRVGTVIPTSVRVVPVHETLISIHPEWRGHSYFVVEDDIIIVDSGHRIVATVPVGSSSGQLEDRGGSVGAGGGGANVDVVDLSPDEIRQVQIVLNQRGFNIGDPDGVLGPRTRQALIQFQQRQGFQATGRFDSRTISALGVSVHSQGQSTTGQGQGQGGGTMQQQPSTNAPAGNQPSANPPPANQQQGNQGGNQPATSGQGSAQQPGAQQPSANQPPANQRSGQGGNQPPTTGQGGAQNNPGTSGSPNMNQPNQPSQGGAGSRNTPAQDGQSR